MIIQGTILAAFFDTAWPLQDCAPFQPFILLFTGGFSLAVIKQAQPLLLTAVALKIAVFVWLTRRLIPWHKAAIYLLIASILSVTAGMVIAVPYISPGLFLALISIPVSYGIALSPARRYRDWLSSQLHMPVNAKAVAGIVTLFFVGSFVLFVFSVAMIVDHPSRLSSVTYWILKIGYIYLALLLNIGLTIYIEESVVSHFANLDNNDLSCLPAVARANFAALLLLTITGIIVEWPAVLVSVRLLSQW